MISSKMFSRRQGLSIVLKYIKYFPVAAQDNIYCSTSSNITSTVKFSLHTAQVFSL